MSKYIGVNMEWYYWVGIIIWVVCAVVALIIGIKSSADLKYSQFIGITDVLYYVVMWIGIIIASPILAVVLWGTWMHEKLR